MQGILKRDKKRRKKIEAAGIDYECPEIVRKQASRYPLMSFLVFTLLPLIAGNVLKIKDAFKGGIE